ncbi:MAG: SDR family NAD(P)-dependent oxidoreductase [Elusimicrobia bacterium]|nr:SDR family NAD(P)-dependent oxidoreductase [Candidatus Obscuribacterium magneticum]
MLILITGGSKGIGKSLAREYLEMGESVIIIADGAQPLESAHAELKTISPSVWSYKCDVGDSQAVRKMAEKVLTEHGCPDILVNNAGFATYRTFDGTPYEEMERLIEVNLLGALRCTHLFLPHMIKRNSGHIVFVASIGGLIPITPCAGYGSAKYGMAGISKMLQYELLDYDIHVHLFCPGRVNTSFFDGETFRRRTVRPEMEKAMPVERASRAIIAMIRKNRFFTIIPASLRWAYRLYRVFPLLLDPFMKKVMSERVRQLRKDEEKHQAKGDG